MIAPAAELTDPALHQNPDEGVRLRAAADARFLLSLARAARVDGLPKGDLRAANAKSAARKVVEHARRSSPARQTPNPCDQILANRADCLDATFEMPPLALLAIPPSVLDRSYTQSV